VYYFEPRKRANITAIQVSTESIPQIIEAARGALDVVLVSSKSAWFKAHGTDPFEAVFGDWLVRSGDGHWRVMSDEALQRDYRCIGTGASDEHGN